MGMLLCGFSQGDDIATQYTDIGGVWTDVGDTRRLHPWLANKDGYLILMFRYYLMCKAPIPLSQSLKDLKNRNSSYFQPISQLQKPPSNLQCCKEG